MCGDGNTGTDLQAQWHKQRFFTFSILSTSLDLPNFTWNLLFLQEERRQTVAK